MLKELRIFLNNNYSNVLYTSIDLADLSSHSPAKILLELSKSFSKSNIELFHFSLAYAIYFQKTNKEFLYDDKKSIIKENLGLVSEILSTIDGFGILGIVPDIVNKIYSVSYKKFNLDKELKEDLKNLENMQIIDIEKMLPAFFAYDVNKYLCSRKIDTIVFFFDTYEVIGTKGKNNITKFSSDYFLRELIAQLPGTLFTIQVNHEWIVLSGQLIEVGGIIDSETSVQPYEHELDSIYLGICEILVCSEEVLEV